MALVALALQPLGAQAEPDKSQSERIEKLERAVEQLQKHNAELEQEISGLKNRLLQPLGPRREVKEKRKSRPTEKPMSKKASPPKRNRRFTSCSAGPKLN